ncbi:hypothetical protein GWG65_34330 [Bradyrhizobium sp. CSA207]|uniref:hypothetical protein n=1 Tax=Bradyrhizobium sp. CSA207 TaxID=2698826 RepID=UPI0023B09CEA|nr:hypothetical protein [Bradyrhizobium sp. CSA207]MDE5446352.1 hypothetical protein [Bradyrhizobium sp. CSA207]
MAQGAAGTLYFEPGGVSFWGLAAQPLASMSRQPLPVALWVDSAPSLHAPVSMPLYSSAIRSSSSGSWRAAAEPCARARVDCATLGMIMLQRLSAAVAWASLAFITYATLSSIRDRPKLSSSADLEDVAAFAFLGFA